MRCDKPNPHTPHFWRQGDASAVSPFEGLTSCPGIDIVPETVLAPERDRPVTEDTPDWMPETLNLSDAAALIVRAHMTGNGDRPSPSYYGAMAVWRELTGLEEPDALTLAYQLATLHPPATAVVPPF